MRPHAWATRGATRLADTGPKYRPTRDAAASLLAILEPEIAKLIVVLPDGLRGAPVKLDGRLLAAEEVGRAIAVEPGSVMLVAEPEGQATIERRVELSRGSSTTVVLEPKSDASTGGVGPAPRPDTRPPNPPGPAPAESGGGVRIAGFVVGGLGLAGLATFAVTGAMVLDKQSTLDEACGGPCPDDSQADVIADGRTLQTVANV